MKNIQEKNKQQIEACPARALRNFSEEGKLQRSGACPAKSRQTGRSRGVAVLFAVLVAVLMVSIAATMTSIAVRQTILSNTGRDSQYAIFAANTALECALYWDLINYDDSRIDFASSTDKVFPNTAMGEKRPSNISNENIECNGINIVTGVGTPDSSLHWSEIDENKTKFYIVLRPNNGSATYCANATVIKGVDGTTATTVIEARGYNTCDLSSPRAIERGLELSYTS